MHAYCCASQLKIILIVSYNGLGAAPQYILCIWEALPWKLGGSGRELLGMLASDWYRKEKKTVWTDLVILNSV